jgi:hypothetical protein
MQPGHFRFGASWGNPFMKFTLTYEGELPSSGNKPKNDAKWRIRRHFCPQLKDLWENHPALLFVEDNRNFPMTAGLFMQRHHEAPKRPITPPQGVYAAGDATGGMIDLCEPIDKFGLAFKPLVRNRFLLHCGLKVLFLRRESPGGIYNAGDIDGRVKTLLDALAMPQHREQMVSDPDAPSPFLCLLEDDSLISGLNIETERLLGGDNMPTDYAKLTIEVDVRVKQATMYNQSFLS